MSSVSQQPTPNFGDEMRRYAAAGYQEHILPIIPPDATISQFAGQGIPGSRGKIPGRRTPDGWTGYGQWNQLVATASDIDTWSAWRCGFGLQCRAVPAVDIDVLDPSFAEQTQALALAHFGPAPVRYGRRPKRLLAYRWLDPKNPGKKLRLAFTLPGSDAKHAVELLGAGQQFVANGIHPGTKQPYAFSDGVDPATVGYDGLTPITDDQRHAFLDALRALIERNGGVVLNGASARGGDTPRKPKPPIVERNPLDASKLKAPDDEMLIDAIRSLPNDYDRHDWIRLTAAMKAGANDLERVYSAYEEWCMKYDGNTPAIAKATWDSINDAGSGAEAVFREAGIRVGFSQHVAAEFRDAPEDDAPSPTDRRPDRHLDSGSDIEIANRIAEHLRAQYSGNVIYTEGAFWCWNGMHWEVIDIQSLRRLAYSWDSCRHGKSAQVRLSEQRVNSIIKTVATLLSPLDKIPFFATRQIGVPALNGFVVVQHDGSIDLRTHCPSHRNRHVIAADYDAENLPWAIPGRDLVVRLLDGCFEGDPCRIDKIRLIAQMLGVAAAGNADQLLEPKAFVLYGPSAANGKSAILGLFRALVPENARCSISLLEFKDESARVGLLGKTLNAVDELSAIGGVAADQFKKIVSGDPTSGRDLYQSRIEFRPAALNIFATNKTPRFTGGMDPGVRRRLAMIPFNRIIPLEERVPRIEQLIEANELDAVLALAVAGLQDLVRNGLRYHTFAEAESALDDWHQDSDIVAAWFAQAAVTVHTDKAAKTSAQAAYRDFIAFADANGRQRHTLPAQTTVTQWLRAKQIPSWKSEGLTVFGMTIDRCSSVGDFDDLETSK